MHGVNNSEITYFKNITCYKYGFFKKQKGKHGLFSKYYWPIICLFPPVITKTQKSGSFYVVTLNNPHVSVKKTRSMFHATCPLWVRDRGTGLHHIQVFRLRKVSSPLFQICQSKKKKKKVVLKASEHNPTRAQKRKAKIWWTAYQHTPHPSFHNHLHLHSKIDDPIVLPSYVISWKSRSSWLCPIVTTEVLDVVPMVFSLV